MPNYVLTLLNERGESSRMVLDAPDAETAKVDAGRHYIGYTLTALDGPRAPRKPNDPKPGITMEVAADGYVIKHDGKEWIGAADGIEEARAKAETRLATLRFTRQVDRRFPVEVLDAGTPPPAPDVTPTTEKTRHAQLLDAMTSYDGRVTKAGKPYLADFRRHSGMADVTAAELAALSE